MAAPLTQFLSPNSLFWFWYPLLLFISIPSLHFFLTNFLNTDTLLSLKPPHSDTLLINQSEDQHRMLVWFYFIAMDKYEAVKDLGAGNFGVARLMRNKVTKELVAMKYIERGPKVSSFIQSLHQFMIYPNPFVCLLLY